MEQGRISEDVHNTDSSSVSEVSVTSEDAPQITKRSIISPRISLPQRIFEFLFFGLCLAWSIAGCVINYKNGRILLTWTIILGTCWFIHRIIPIHYILSKFVNACMFEIKPLIKTICSGILALILLLACLFSSKAPWSSKGRALVSFFLYPLICFLFNKNKKKLKLYPIFAFYNFFFILGLIIFRWNDGKKAFKSLSDQIMTILSYVTFGENFSFGAEYKNLMFLTNILPVVIWLGGLFFTFFYLGWMGLILKKLTWFFNRAFNISGIISLTGSLHMLFIGQIEAAAILGDFIQSMTRFEVFCKAALGFTASSAGAAYGYAQMGAKFELLVAAFVLSFSSCMILCSFMDFEDETSSTYYCEPIVTTREKYNNVVEAMSDGAVQGWSVLTAILSILIFFISLIQLINTVLKFIGEAVGIHGMILSKILSYPLGCLGWFIGCSQSDTWTVGQYLGAKLSVNEFFTFQEFVIPDFKNKKISEHTFHCMCVTICSFANIGSVAMQIAALLMYSKGKQKVITTECCRALIPGFLAPMMSGALYAMLHSN